MFRFLKSKERKEAETIIASLAQLTDEARAEIAHMERQLTNSQKVIASVHIRRAVMFFSREIQAVEQLRADVRRFSEAGKTANAFGTMVGSRLVMAGVFLKLLAGKPWIEAALYVAMLEGFIHGFMERVGDKPWPVRYAEDFSFERYRLEYVAKKEAEAEQNGAE